MKLLYAVIKKTKNKPAVRHYEGLPPEATDGKDHRKKLPFPNVLLIEKKKNGYFLIRYTFKGEFCGDTWHQSVEDAKKQAKYEYGTLLGEWKEIEKDWRIKNQKKYLKGATLKWAEWRSTNSSWDHDHCAFCGQKFCDECDDPDANSHGYSTLDEYYWICKTCFDDFEKLFEWKINED